MGNRIPILGLGQLSKSPYVTAKQIQNLYAEPRPEGEKSQLVAYGTPGLNTFVYSFGATACRGGIEFESGSVAYVVHGNVLYEVNNAGNATPRGNLIAIANYGRVSMSHNGVQVMIVDGVNGYIYNTNTTVFAQITDGDFPANPTTVTYLSRRFIISVDGSSRFYVSDIDDGLSWDATMFANAESSPDPIVSVWTSNGQLVLLGSLTTEFWGNSGALDFPFVALQGTANEWGLAARWSIAKYDNTFACLIKNRMGQVMIAKMNGYLPERISNPDLDNIINAYSSTADASAYSYMLGGHPMYVITFPTAGASWQYDGLTSIWTQLKSYGLTRYIGEFAFTLLGSTIVADYNTGILYRLSSTAYTDNASPIERKLVSETVALPDLSLLSVECLRVDMEVGDGLAYGQGSNPQIGLRVSRDNGKTWGPQVWKTFGAIGEYLTRVEWRRLGTYRSFVFEFSITDPVKVVFVSACINPDS